MTTEKTLPTLIAEVSAQLARLEKKGIAPQAMGSFKFVRETDVMDALKPELDARGIVLRPDVELLRIDTFDRQGKDMPNTVATVSLAMWAVRGEEEYLISRTVGQGADTQDKAVGKAVTSAKKQAFLIAFAIPTGDDPDAHAIPERAARRNQQPAGERSLEAPAKTPPATYRRDELAALMRAHGLSHRDLERLADQVGITKGSTATPPQMDALIARIQLPPPDDDDLPEPIHQPSGAAGEPESVVPPRADPLPGLTEDEFADLQEGLWPRPGSDEYKALEPVKKAEARAFWQAQA